MKNSKLLILLLGIFFCSCGPTPNADTAQLKAWIMMENVSNNLKHQISQMFVDEILYDGTFEIFNADNRTLELLGEQDSYFVNPWRELLTLRSEDMCGYFGYGWKLNPKEIDLEFYFYNSWLQSPLTNNTYPTLEEIYEKSSGWYSPSNPQRFDYINGALLNTYVKLNQDVAQEVYRAVGRAYIDFVREYAEEVVSVKDWDYCKHATTQSCTGYYVTYEIGEGFYVLVRYVEEDEGSGFQIQRLYAGESIIELEQAMEEDMYDVIFY